MDLSHILTLGGLAAIGQVVLIDLVLAGEQCDRRGRARRRPATRPAQAGYPDRYWHRAGAAHPVRFGGHSVAPGGRPDPVRRVVAALGGLENVPGAARSRAWDGVRGS